MKRVLKKFWRENLGILFWIVCASACTIIASFMNAKILNALIALDIKQLVLSIVFLLSSYSLFLLLSYIKIRKQSEVTQKMSTDLRGKIMKKIASLEYEDYHKESVGAYSSWLTNDINQIEQLGFNSFYELLEGVIGALMAIIALFMVHWSLIFLTIIEVILLLQIPRIFGGKIDDSTEKMTKDNEAFLSETTDVLSAYDTVFSFRKFSYMTQKVIDSSKKLSQSKVLQSKIMAKVMITGGTGNVLCQVSIYALTAYLAVMKIVSVGTMSITGSFSAEIFNTVGNMSQYLAAISSTRPLFEKFDCEEVSEQPTLKQTTLNQGFILSEVGYGYEETNTLFSNLNYEFKLGHKYAVLGESGAGKSTLLNILSGKRKGYTGHVHLNGQELSQISTNQLFADVLYIDQEPHVFDGTIRDNLEMGDTYSDSDLWRCLEEADLKDTILSFPNGLDTYTGEKGKLISGGQRQRLAIARGLLRDKKIILLDEITSKLDNKTANKIEDYLIKCKGLTVIMITHQLKKNIEQQLDGVLYLT